MRLTRDGLVIRMAFWETGMGRLGLVAVLLSPFALLLPNGESGTGGLIGLGVFCIGMYAFRPTLVITPDLVMVRRRFAPPLQANRAPIRYLAVYNDKAVFTDQSGRIVLTMSPGWRSMKKYTEAAAALGAELTDSRYVKGSWRNPYSGGD